MIGIRSLLVSGGTAVLLTGAMVLGSGSTASAATPNCGQMERDYWDAVHDATSYYELGTVYEQGGEYHQAEYWFRQYRYKWLNISNMQLC